MRSTKYRLTVLLAPLILAACGGGGGGGGGSIPENAILIEGQTVITNYQDGDQLTYLRFHEIQRINGEDIGGGGGLAEEEAGFSFQDYERVTYTREEFFCSRDGQNIVDAGHSLLHEISSDDVNTPEPYTTELGRDSGVVYVLRDSMGRRASCGAHIDELLMVHQPYSKGHSWDIDAVYGEGSFEPRSTQGRFRVQGIDAVDTPYGVFEAYKIKFNSDSLITSEEGVRRQVESGMRWVNPKFGLVATEQEIRVYEDVESDRATNIVRMSSYLFDASLSGVTD